MRAALRLLALPALFAAALMAGNALRAAEGEVAVERDYSRVTAAPAPQVQPGATAAERIASVEAKSAGCYSCHVRTDAPTMHETPAVELGCTDCHGGDAQSAEARGNPDLGYDHPFNRAALEKAHVLPRYPDSWNYPTEEHPERAYSSANPERSYALLNREAPQFIRFTNPSDYRVAREACGACHMETIEAGERSLMATGAMLWGGAAYNNGMLPYKNYATGEAYTREGEPACIVSPSRILDDAALLTACDPNVTADQILTAAELKRGALAKLYPLPTWQVFPPADVFRVFERGGRNIGTQFAEIGLPNPTGSIQRLDEPGRPDLKQSNRGPATGLRVAIPILNIHKTRLNDPFTWFMGTNDQPGDYRHSGCASCHVIYSNDREPRHSLIYAEHGRDGQTMTVDPTIARLMQAAEPDGHGELLEPGEHDQGPAVQRRPGQVGGESGHPLRHVFTRAIPTAQCMNCHMHQPNIFLNSYLGYTMWDYESDAPAMWPTQQQYPSAEEVRHILDRNPEGAAPRGRWADLDFLRNVYGLNPELRDTQFADYHGHGWNFRAILKRDREGNLLDAEGRIVDPDDPSRWRKPCAEEPTPELRDLCNRNSTDGREPEFVPPGINPGRTVHLMDIHAEKGMQCADCHFAQDSHGNGLIYGEVANAVEIGCKDCHGTPDDYPTLMTSGPAAPPRGNNLALLRNPDGQRRFEWSVDDETGRPVLTQRSIVDRNLEWEVSLVRDAVDTSSRHFNPEAARAKLMSRTGAETGKFEFGPGIAPADRAHRLPEMACFTCHLSWTTSCGGCHLPIEANWESEVHRYEGETTRNFATYNPQVARDDMFQLGRHMTTKGNQIAPVRSTSALILSSTNLNRERIYVQQPPISASGFSSQAFAPHFPHTVRLNETKTCSDCHLSDQDDNNAIMAQLLLLGTNYVNFVGLNAWTGLEGGFEAVRVTEWDEPQAVLGSYLHRYAYPDYYDEFVNGRGRELKDWTRGSTFTDGLSGERDAMEQFANVHEGTSGRVGCLQLRGEYMYVAEGKGGFRVYDVASIANKGVSERIITAPFSSLGHDTRVDTRNATCMALPTNQPIAPTRSTDMAATNVLDSEGKPVIEADGTPLTLLEANQEQRFSPIYNYAFITDAEEGLIAVNVNTLADGEFRNNNLRRAVTFNPGGVLTGARHITLAGDYAYIVTDRSLVTVRLPKANWAEQPCTIVTEDENKETCLAPEVTSTIALTDPRASAVQFRYLWVTDAEGVKLFDVTVMETPVAVPSGTVRLADARRLYIARTYAYVAAKQDGLVILNVTRPTDPQEYLRVTFDGRMNDVEDVIVGSTNASLFAYVADGRNGMKVVQLTSPDSQRNFYGFSPRPMPELIAWARTPSPAIAMSKGLDRDRAVDETGGQIAVFGRLGARPFTRAEMQSLFMTDSGVPWKVSDQVDMAAWVPGDRRAVAAGGD